MLSLSSCSSVYYLFQAGRGQLKLLNRGVPINSVIEDPKSSPELNSLLKKIPDIKKFGEKEGLKPTSNYREYVKLEEDAVVYVVTVSDPLQFKPKIFSFPLVGSFNYLGWFSKEDAKKFATTFEKAGFDVDVRGAAAYSTLGWFKDPLLSSMIPKVDGKIMPEAYPELVNVFLHESVHATLYISNQSYFNESLACFVADLLTESYFKERGELASSEYQDYLKNRDRYSNIRKRMSETYQELKKVYDSALALDAKKVKKAEILGSLERELGFHRAINNATLIQFQTYDPGDHGFGILFKKTNEDVRTFLQLLSQLKAKDFEHPQMEELSGVLEKLLIKNYGAK